MGIKLMAACLFAFLLSACSTPRMMKVSDTMAIKDYMPPRAEEKTAEEVVDRQAQYRAQEQPENSHWLSGTLT